MTQSQYLGETQAVAQLPQWSSSPSKHVPAQQLPRPFVLHGVSSSTGDQLVWLTVDRHSVQVPPRVPSVTQVVPTRHRPGGTVQSVALTDEMHWWQSLPICTAPSE